MESARGDYSISSDARQAPTSSPHISTSTPALASPAVAPASPPKSVARSGAEFEQHTACGIGEGQSQHHLQISIRRACWDTASHHGPLVLPQFRYAAYFFALSLRPPCPLCRRDLPAADADMV